MGGTGKVACLSLLLPVPLWTSLEASWCPGTGQALQIQEGQRGGGHRHCDGECGQLLPGAVNRSTQLTIPAAGPSLWDLELDPEAWGHLGVREIHQSPPFPGKDLQDVWALGSPPGHHLQGLWLSLLPGSKALAAFLQVLPQIPATLGVPRASPAPPLMPRVERRSSSLAPDPWRPPLQGPSPWLCLRRQTRQVAFLSA